MSPRALRWRRSSRSPHCRSRRLVSFRDSEQILSSSPAKAGDPVFQSTCDLTEKPRRTGYPAFAGYDGKIQCTRKHQQLQPSYAGLTRVSIDHQQKHFSKGWVAGSSPAMTIWRVTSNLLIV